MFRSDKMVKRGFYHIQVKRVGLEHREVFLHSLTPGEERNVVGNDHSRSQQRAAGHCSRVNLILDYSNRLNSKQWLLPRQELTIATLEGRILCRSRGNQVWKRPLGWRTSCVPKQLQSGPNQTQRRRPTLWSKPAVSSSAWPLLSCLSGGDKMFPKQV